MKPDYSIGQIYELKDINMPFHKMIKLIEYVPIAKPEEDLVENSWKFLVWNGTDWYQSKETAPSMPLWVLKFYKLSSIKMTEE